jgi:hypothetical protein
MQFPRAVDFDSGIAMVVTDLHGEGHVYDRLLKKFFDLRAKGEVDRLILCGDLIHGRGSEDEDESLRMILDVIRLQKELGRDTITMLMGNHEMPHVYSFILSKAHEEYTSRFEHSMTKSGKRNEIINFLYDLPICVRTKAGVYITHAGATQAVLKDHDATRMLTIDHKALVKLVDDKMASYVNFEELKTDKKYLNQAKQYFAISGPDDPRLHHMLRGQLISQLEEEFEFVWDILFSRCEQDSSVTTYNFYAEHFLKAISEISDYQQRVIVAGHIGIKGGHKGIGERHLRIASYSHAHPHQAGEYLLLDCAKPVQSAIDLLPHLRPTFG